MDKTAIKNFAISARKTLKTAVAQKAYDIGVLEDKAVPVSEVQGGFIYSEQSYSKEELAGRKKLIDTIKLRADGKGYKHGYSQVIEEVAYTWFNRLIALRFMELNGYLPSNIRILSSVNPDRLEPDCIREVENLDFIDMRKVGELSHDTEKLYRYILIAQCNVLANIMPKMFEKIADYTELLLPDRLYLQEGNIVYDLVHGITEADFTEQVEIIGWLYQFYISEKKDEVFAGLKKNIKITKENIPAATQLFTPDWIVKYMVENSLGRLAVEKLDIDPVEMGWKYYLKEAEQTDEVMEQLAVINGDKKDFDIKNVKIIDPCMGSGHILVYAFDLLYQIYEKLGYVAREIPNLILENNIFGLDIDGRAGQLAYFAMMMKARNYNRRFFRQDNVPQPQVYATLFDSEIAVYSRNMGDFLLDKTFDTNHQTTLEYLITAFADLNEYGSLIKLENRDYKGLLEAWENYAAATTGDFNLTLWFAFMENVVPDMIKIAIVLSEKYDVVVTNPPYMGGSGMGAKLSEYVKKNFPTSKSDLFAVFIEKCGEMLKPNGYQAMITQHAWMFLSSYEKLRKQLLQKDIVNMAHLGARAFEEIGGEVVQTTAFVLRNSNITDYRATFVRLVDYNSQQAKETVFLSGSDRHTAVKENFEKIPGMPVAYWVSKRVIDIFATGITLENIAKPRVGLQTSNNERFIMLWHEINYTTIGFGTENHFATSSISSKWFPHNKGGEYRKWYGNNYCVVDYWNNGFNVKQDKLTRLQKGLIEKKNSQCWNEEYYFLESLTWSRISSENFGIRFSPTGHVFDTAGTSIFADTNTLKYLLGILITKITKLILNMINPTLTYQTGDVAKIPIIITNENSVLTYVDKCITISKTDWDSFETSWDFVRHPLVHGIYKKTNIFENTFGDYMIEGAFKEWERDAEERFNILKANEEKLNHIFIEIYGLQEELTPEVEDKDVTIRKADLVRDIKSFISYAVGCMFGRYSLDVDGLAYAGGEWDKSKYKAFIPDEDNILPITDNEYFDDDIVTRFVEFLKVVYGEEWLENNLYFIANALYPNASGTARERIRRYFLNDFYKDHIKTYQKKPIYWQFDSGKQGGFKCLIYLHRYDKYTVARVRTDYLHTLQRKYEAEVKRLQMLSGMTENAREKGEYRKQIEKIEKQLTECRAYDPALAHIANQTIELDLDDGVTVNYGKFMGIDVLQGDGKGKTTIDLLSKI